MDKFPTALAVKGTGATGTTAVTPNTKGTPLSNQYNANTSA